MIEMVLVIHVQALSLPNSSHRLQQTMAKIKVNLEKTEVSEFLLWIWEVKKTIKENWVTGFIHT